MKQIMAIIRMNRMNATKQALSDAGITSFTATGGVLGRGKGFVDYRILHAAQEGREEAVALLGTGPRLNPKRLLSIVVSDDWSQRTIDALLKANRTGHAGDGKIFVLPVTEATRVRTGETVSGPSGGNVLDSSGGLK